DRDVYVHVDDRMTIIPNDSAKIPRTSEAASSGSQSRPLPTPGATTTPSQPENSAHNQLPPVPPRRKHGSVHTAFYPPQASSTARPRVPSPPPYEDDTQQYRAPVALPASPASSMPDLIEASAPPAQTTSQQRSVAPWGNPKSDWNNVAWGENQPSWEITNGDYSGWGKANDAFDASEERWWDRDLMAIGRVKPGPGYLPSAVLGYLHPFIGGMHHIYRVTVTPPDFPPSPEVNHPRSPAPPSSPSIQMTSTSPSTSSALAPHPAPTKEEVLTTIPHPHAIFCRKHGIWLYHQVRTSVHLPPTETYPDSYPFPDQASRKSCTSCVDSEAGAAEEQLYLSSNHVKTHHFHFYQGAIRGSSLSPPFVKPPTLTSARSERRSRKGSSASTTSRPDEPSIVPSEEIWLDLYVCCQCQTHLIVSNESATIPSVIDSKLLRDYIQDRQHNPPPNKTGQEAVMLALETLLRIFENFIFKQNMSATYCNPAETFKYYTALNTIFQWASSVGDSSQEVLGNLIATELSRGRWTAEALREAVNILGLGTLLDDSGAMNVGDDFDAARIKECWLQKLKETNAAFNSQPDLDRDMLNRKKQDLKEAFRIVSEATGRADAVAAYEESVKLFGNGMMDVAAAYSTLEVPADLDEEMVVTIYGMRVDDQPLAEERMRSALMIIAEDRGSERLKNLALTGKDDGPPPPESSRREWPRGLQQLGNTCYLNSLLQYFYTIKELREAITNMDPDNVADVSENDIKQDRVGGRLVSRREVERSKKFVSLLRELFWQLQWSEDAAVKPEVELAKLALVTSKDEEDDIKSEGSDATHASSLQSGSTLVDEPMPFSPGGDSPNADAVEANASVLGKRPGDALERAPTRHAASESDAQPEKDGYVMIEAPKQTTAKSTSGENTAGPVSRDESDVVMHDQQGQDSQVANPPPLPPRKKAEQKTEGTMMFGKQHDVSECMDNCMFQIEAAMKFGLDKTGLKTEDHGS
ncbi:ubiquitin-specific protease ubp2, partial [Tulasnella sp. 403]